MSRNLICVPQSGTGMKDSIEEATKIAKALDSAGLYAFVILKYNDIQIGINEKCDPEYTLEELKGKIAKRYERANHM